MVDMVLPQLGESVSEGTVSKWFVKEGDTVKKDQPVVSIATDKADSDLPAPVTGRIVRLIATEGATLPVKSLLCQIEEGDFAGATPPPAAAPAAAPAGGNAPAAASPSRNEPSSKDMLASPAIRDRARQLGVDLSTVKGSGEMGRLTMEDVERASRPAAPTAAPSAQVPAGNTARAQAVAQVVNQGFSPPIPGVGYGAFKVPAYRPTPGDQVIPFNRRRRITADHMTYSKFASPHVVTVAEVDLFRTAAIREANKERYKKEGLPLTMLSFAVTATTKALRENPNVNARVLDDSYVLYKDIHVGVAVDSPDGLVVPVIRRADELGVRGITRAIDELAKRARTGKLTADDLSGATFSVSNPGLKGNLFGGAIINQPNVGILRMGEIVKRVVVIDGPNGEDIMAIHPIMYMALSYDHRIVDGVAANAFLWRITEILEKGEFEV
ncbi:MAG: 2-oxo acid dehydrogenase subunit E2 [Polyangiaceae bacterium]|nr:2-oxo acid dehydrogenase subunit E2 [Polyangiaceae bacterium]